jgi:periplasmic protein TonB
MTPITPRLWVDDAGTGSSPSVLATAFAAACVVHLILLFGVSFELPETKPSKHRTRPLEIVVLRQAAPTDEKPEIADAFAQVDRVGGSIEPDTQIAPNVEPSPEVFEVDPAPENAVPPPALPPPPPTALQPVDTPPPAPAVDETLSAIIEPKPLEPEPPPEAPPLAQPESILEPPTVPAPPAITAAQILASRNLEIAELTSKIQNSSAAYANRPRRKAISASTREYKYASYLDAWRRKVERVGNLNYPDEAKRHKMYGSLILHTALRADGSIERVHVLRSSGFEVLDEAAVKIVELAAPFAPFPPDIRADTDILDITRTWQFLSNNRLGWEN